MRPTDFDVALVLSGGAALGAYQAGVYEALHEAGWLPDHVAGSSIGAINGVLIAGNRPESRVDRLRRFWAMATEPGAGPKARPPEPLARAQAYLAAVRARLLGRPGLYLPQFMESLAMVPVWRRPGLYDLSPLLGSLGQLADFAGLDRGGTRLTVHATDLGTGEAVRFDSHERPVEPIHVQGSTTLIPDFVPVEVEGRLLCDGGYSENLPLRAALGAMPERPLLCLAVDLMAAERPPRWSLDGMAERQQDLHFASQTRALAAAVTAELTLAAERSKHPAPPVVLAHLVYRGREDAGSQKAYDYSPQSISARWSHGLEDGRTMAETLAGLSVASGSGVTVLRFPLPEHAPEPNRAKAA